MYVNANDIINFDSCEVENMPTETKKSTGNKNIITNIYRIQGYDFMCGYFCIVFIDFMLKGKNLLHFTKSFPPNGYEKNDKIMLKYFQ